MNRRFTLKAVAGAAALAIVAACAPMDGGDDIVDIAASDGRFTTLVTAVQAAGLVDTLKGICLCGNVPGSRLGSRREVPENKSWSGSAKYATVRRTRQRLERCTDENRHVAIEFGSPELGRKVVDVDARWCRPVQMPED